MTNPHPRRIVAIERGRDAVAPVCDAVKAWLRNKRAQEARQRRRQAMEHAVLVKCRATGLNFAAACAGASSEARALRGFMQQIKNGDEDLDREAACIVRMRAASMVGVFAKFEMVVVLQEPSDCETHAWALLRSGLKEMRAML